MDPEFRTGGQVRVPLLNPNPPMDGARVVEGGEGVTGAMIRARFG